MCIPQLMREVSEYSTDVYCGVVAPKAGFSDFYSEAFDRIDRERSIQQKTPKTTPIKFNTISLEQLIRTVSHVNRVEIDCEGAELAIFEDFSFDVKPDVFKIACHGDEIRSELHRIFQEHGYTVNDIDEEHILCKIGNPVPEALEIFQSA